MILVNCFIKLRLREHAFTERERVQTGTKHLKKVNRFVSIQLIQRLCLKREIMAQTLENLPMLGSLIEPNILVTRASYFDRNFVFSKSLRSCRWLGNEISSASVTVVHVSHCDLDLVIVSLAKAFYVFICLGCYRTSFSKLQLSQPTCREAFCETLGISITSIRFVSCGLPFLQGSFTFEYLPLKSGEVIGRLTLSSSDLGFYQYDLNLTATPAGSENQVHFRTYLGSTQNQTCRFINFCKSRVEYSCKVRQSFYGSAERKNYLPLN